MSTEAGANGGAHDPDEGDSGSGEESGSVSEEESERGEDGNDSEEEVTLDPEGRVPFAGELDYTFRSFPGAVRLSSGEDGGDVLPQLIKDCQAVFTARARELEYSTGETFWVQADREASGLSALERMALDIFRFHTGTTRFDAAASGAEWWTQVIDQEDDIGWHWDKDYELEAGGVNVHPHLATVTYLTVGGGPTLILDKKGPMLCAEPVTGEVPRAWLSLPRVGKHVSFDGRLLHAAPSDLARSPSSSLVGAASGSGRGGGGRASEGGEGRGVKRPREGGDCGGAGAGPNGGAEMKAERKDGEGEEEEGRGGGWGGENGEGGPEEGHASAAAVVTGEDSGPRPNSPPPADAARRVTFLVNVWLNHRPGGASPLPEQTAALLSRKQVPLALGAQHPATVLAVRPAARGSDDDAGSGNSATTTPASAAAATGTAAPSLIATPAATAAAPAAADASLPAVGMRWEFGEVGEAAEDQVHERHGVFVPVPVKLLPAAPQGAGAGAGAGAGLEAGAGAGAGAEAGAGAGAGPGTASKGHEEGEGGGGGGGGVDPDSYELVFSAGGPAGVTKL